MPEKIKKLGQFFAVASHSRTFSLLVILLIVAAVPLTVFVAQKQQEIRQRAETGVKTCTQLGDNSSECDDNDPCTKNICVEDEYVKWCINPKKQAGEDCAFGVCNGEGKCVPRRANCDPTVSNSCTDSNLCTEDKCFFDSLSGEYYCNYSNKPPGTDCGNGAKCDSQGKCTSIRCYRLTTNDYRYQCFEPDLDCSLEGWTISGDTSCPNNGVCCYKYIGPTCSYENGCNSQKEFCNNGHCVACSEGYFNCDYKEHCESSKPCSSASSCECVNGKYKCSDSSDTREGKSCGAAQPTGTGGSGTTGGTKCEDSGTNYNPGDKRWECTNPKTKGPCAEGKGVGVPFVCENDTTWRNANPYGECIAECKPEAGSTTQNTCTTLKMEGATFQCYPGSCPSTGGWNQWNNASCPSDAKCCVQYSQTGSGGTGTSGTGGSGSNAPTCDSGQVQMSFSPSSSKVSETITFNVSGSQGSTHMNDVWSPDGGVDCSGPFWDKKECKAKKEGTYNWTHKWKNCAPNNCSVTSSECSKELSFTINPNPSPTTASCPALGTADAPSELKYTCDTTNKKINLSWKAPSNSNVTSYSIRVDKNPTSWNGNCSSPLEGDSCADPTTTSYTVENIDTNATYRVWIHSRDSCGNWSPIQGTKAEITFSCKPLSLNLQAWWIDGTDWTPITPRIELIVRDYIINGERVCIPEGEKNNIEIYNSDGVKLGLLKDYQTVPPGGYVPGQGDYNCGAYMDWGKHTAFRLFGTKQQIKDKGLPNKIKFKIPNFTNMSNEVELMSTIPVPTTPACSILNGPCGWGIAGQPLGTCCGVLRCDLHPDGGTCKNASDVQSNPDVDRDGCIGIKDADLWLRAFKKEDNPPYKCPQGYTCGEANYYPNINKDEVIDFLDFTEWLKAMVTPGTNRCGL